MATQEIQPTRRETTLPGLGPKLELSEIQLHQWRQAQQSEFERWAWFDRQLADHPHADDVLRWMTHLDARPRLPGRVEQALVALSRNRRDGLAMMALREFEPAPGDHRLRRFYEVCLIQARQLDR